jgi:hypothetical protein
MHTLTGKLDQSQYLPFIIHWLAIVQQDTAACLMHNACLRQRNATRSTLTTALLHTEKVWLKHDAHSPNTHGTHAPLQMTSCWQRAGIQWQ